MLAIHGLPRRLAHKAADSLPALDGLRRIYRNAKQTRSMRRWLDADDRAERLYREWIGPNDLVFDVGANIGARTKVFARLARFVVAVEPEPNALGLLRRHARHWPNVAIEPVACGARSGRARLLAPYATNLASLSPEHVAAVQRSGRFADVRWTRHYDIQLTTLDVLIHTYGCPAFVKIDVEGYETDVLEGLSQPIAALSFEVMAERVDALERCIARLAGLGSYRYGFSEGETLKLDVKGLSATKLLDWLREQRRRQPRLLGDVYAVHYGAQS